MAHPPQKEIIAHADEIGGKIGENLRAALDQLPLSRELATIRRDLDLDVTPDRTVVAVRADLIGEVEPQRRVVELLVDGDPEGGVRLVA